MNHLTGIYTPAEQRMFNIYVTAYKKAIEEAIQSGEEKPKNIFKVIYYGVKTVNTYPPIRDKRDAEHRFMTISALKNTMSLLTLREFMSMFPIDKKYNGKRWDFKDYYSTIEAIQELGLKDDEPIGDKILYLLSEYMNRDILDFSVEGAVVLSALRRYDGHLDLLEEFQASQGTATENTFKNSKGEVMYVRHGKPVKLKVNRQQRKHLRLVK